MKGTISEGDVIRLRQPCKNRAVTLQDNKDGTVSIDGQEFDRSIDVECFLETLPRKDLSLNHRVN